jgi:NAD(P)H-dependent FMN reductase
MVVAEHRSGLHVTTLVGSVTAPGRLRRAVEEASDRIRPLVAHVELIDLGEHRMSFADGREPSSFVDDTGAVVEAIERAHVVAFATPVYRGSMTGALKNVFDLLPLHALAAKVVALVAMGASDHHFLGADRHWRDVLTFFGAIPTPASAYLTGADFTDGVPREQAAATLDELLAGAVRLAAALAQSGGGELGPAPLGVRAERARSSTFG